MTDGLRPRSVRSIAQLKDAGVVDDAEAAELAEVASKYAVSITPSMLERIESSDPEQAVRRQFVPTDQELTITPEELADPISDEPFTPVPGVVHRYPDRVLLKPLLACPVYCRFCFRRETVGQGVGALPEDDLVRAFEYIESQSDVWEVILSGGDPLILSARRLRRIFDRLESIDHVRVIRIHSRVPVVDPERISSELCEIMDREVPVWIVVHVNAAEEIGPEAEGALRRLSRSGVPLLSQTVLLRGVNDSPEQLEALFRLLVRNRVKPYYLHHGDLAHGTSHFRTSIDEGQALMRELRGNVSGLCQLTYTLDIPGGHGKVPIGPSYAERTDAGWRIADPSGQAHDYPPESAPATPAD